MGNRWRERCEAVVIKRWACIVGAAFHTHNAMYGIRYEDQSDPLHTCVLLSLVPHYILEWRIIKCSVLDRHGLPLSQKTLVSNRFWATKCGVQERLFSRVSYLKHEWVTNLGRKYIFPNVLKVNLSCVKLILSLLVVRNVSPFPQNHCLVVLTYFCFFY